jgi:hypothetical protein
MKRLQFFKELTKDTLSKIFILFIWVILTFTIISLFNGSIKLNDILGVIDSYIKLILSSWPASILIISSVVLYKHHDAINHFIKNRMTEIGPGGVKGETYKVKDATDSEIKHQRIKEVQEDDKVIEGILEKKQSEINIETGIRNIPPESQKEEVIKRYQKISQIEEAVQTSLIAKYADRYKSQVKVSNNEKSIILDGILYSKNGKKPTAIEIKYISSKNYEAIKFIISRKKTKLAVFGIKRIILVLVGDSISPEEASEIQKDNQHQSEIYFYNWDNGGLTEIETPLINKHLF